MATALVAVEVLVAAGLLADRLALSQRAAPTTAVPVVFPSASARSQSSGTRGPAATAPTRPAAVGRRPAASPRAAGLVASGPVNCDTDLPLVASPPSDYNFLCSQGGIPVTWSKSRLVFDVENLSAVQTAAFDAAIGRWATAARFQVVFTSSSRGADVIVKDAPLGNGQAGFVEDGYTTVSYRCAPVCIYSSARIELSTTATLSESDWLSTVLHELGHVAGLNHVSVAGEVMYPYLTADPPQAYSPGDLQGLLILATERGA